MPGTPAKTRFALPPGQVEDAHRPSIAAITQRVISRRRQKIQRRAPHSRRVSLAVRDRDEEIAAARDGDADRGVPRAIGHLEIIGPDPSGHIGDPDDIARRARRKMLAQQIEIGDAIDLIVVGDAAVAIAEADLGPHVDLDLAAARGRAAAKGLARGPAVARKRPGDFPPARRSAAGAAC